MQNIIKWNNIFIARIPYERNNYCGEESFTRNFGRTKGGENEKVFVMQKQHLLMKNVLQILSNAIYILYINLRKNNFSKFEYV